MSKGWNALRFGALFVLVAGCSAATVEDSESPADDVTAVEEAASPVVVTGRVITAQVVALDQAYVYNRFGSFNPAGMIYALRRDVVPIDPDQPIGPGNAMLRETKRPRPLVLRANVGDTLLIRFTNWLAPSRSEIPEPDDTPFHVDSDGDPDDSPFTRHASIHVSGLQVLNIRSLGGNVGQNGSALAAPGETVTLTLHAEREGTFFMHSAGAMTGGQGLGGQIVQGLFGAVQVEPPGARWYRSQVTAADLEAASLATPNRDGTPRIDYEAAGPDGVPILNMLQATSGGLEIVHGDLTAIIANYTSTSFGASISVDRGVFREHSVFFHDELKVVQAFPRLENDPTLESVRDAFGINYGSDGLGARLLANRMRTGPSKDCIECKYEEFFLSSWPNGDPALNVVRDAYDRAIEALYPDDPSNVQHAYLGDPVRVRNVHAGPKETHVYHLHAHQWLRTPNDSTSNYLDAQTIGPGAGYTYDLAYGGAGNRALTAGDAIFHCHLYPHFAAGMWALLRVHDVFEAGTSRRNVPDHEIVGGTPTPALVPLPSLAIPPLPTYEPTWVDDGTGERVERPAMPGYPHYIASVAGRRASQPPLDIDFDGGLPRHVLLDDSDTEASLGGRGEFDVQINKATVKLLPAGGTPAEIAAMSFHAGQFPGARSVSPRYGFPVRGYPAFTPEGRSAEFVVNGGPPAPGAPYANPCPAGSYVREFRTVYLQLNATINQYGWHDPQQRIAVLEQDALATKHGRRSVEPLFIRAHADDCSVLYSTNLLPDALTQDDFQIFSPTDVSGNHVHLVKFDVTSSDGAANGFNYEDGTLTVGAVEELIAAARAAGGALSADGTVTSTGARETLEVRANPRIPFAPRGAQTTVQRWWVDALQDAVGNDRTLRAAFTHDHLAPSSHQQHGLYAALVAEPAGSVWQDPQTGVRFGTRTDGGPTSFKADILTGDPATTVREFNLFIADFTLAYDAHGRPVNPPRAREVPLPIAVAPPVRPMPEAVSSNDPGTMVFNYRNEPLPLRLADREPDGTYRLKPGAAGRMHNVFRSSIHGDPSTPILPIYAGDPFTINLLQGSHEEQHVFSMHDLRWLRERANPDSGYVNFQAIGLSETATLEVNRAQTASMNSGGSVDHLYQSAPTDDLWNGLWGIIRSFGQRTPDLRPLPGHAPLAAAEEPVPTCPPEAPLRQYTVHAILAEGNLPHDRLTYNDDFKLFDPDAILYVKEEHLTSLRRGSRRPEPLILRAAAGDCIQVTLVNDLPRRLPNTPHWNYSPPITPEFNTNQVPHSSHASLHPQLVTYDVNSGDSANVGWNQVQTVPSGESRTYTWYAGEVVSAPGGGVQHTPVEFGTVNLKDMADVVNHGMHGGIGTLIIEPRGAFWLTDPHKESQAIVVHRAAPHDLRIFRELVLLTQDEIGMHSDRRRFQCRDASLNCGTAIRNLGEADDAEETGHEAFNYRNEPIWGRLREPPQISPEELNDFDFSEILSSGAFGDPATPLLRSIAGLPVRFRLAQPSGHGRQHSFSFWGFVWPSNPWAQGASSRVMGPNPEVFPVTYQDGSSALSAWNIVPFNPAGGRFLVRGDYLYRDQASVMFTNGLWGVFRVEP